MEIWKYISGDGEDYQVSKLGRIRSLKRKNIKIMNIKINRHGYCTVYLTKNGILKTLTVHRLVAKAFIPNPENKPCIDHINTIRTDNRVENLRWVTHKENCNNELTIKKKSDNTKGENNPMYGKHHTKEMKEKITNNKERSKKISKSLKGHSVSDESREKISKNHADVSGSNHPRARKIAQYNLNEELIKIWNCISQAEKELGISHISNCCNGKRKTAGGFKWKYVKED